MTMTDDGGGLTRDVEGGAVRIPDSMSVVVESPVGRLRVYVAWPCLGKGVATPVPAAGWPVIWVLDPGAAFAGTVEAMRYCSRRADATGVVPAVVVGVEPELPSSVASDAASNAASNAARARERLLAGEESLGFAAALNDVVRPLVESLVPGRCDTKRSVLVGHSLGGVFALQTALRFPGRYRAVAAVSPSLWQAEGDLTELAVAYPASAPAISVLIVTGEYEQRLAPWEEGTALASETLARRTGRQMIDTARKAADAIGGASVTGNISARFALLAEADHGTVRSAALPLILRLPALV